MTIHRKRLATLENFLNNILIMVLLLQYLNTQRRFQLVFPVVTLFRVRLRHARPPALGAIRVQSTSI